MRDLNIDEIQEVSGGIQKKILSTALVSVSGALGNYLAAARLGGTLGAAAGPLGAIAGGLAAGLFAYYYYGE